MNIYIIQKIQKIRNSDKIRKQKTHIESRKFRRSKKKSRKNRKPEKIKSRKFRKPKKFRIQKIQKTKEKYNLEKIENSEPIKFRKSKKKDPENS